MGKDMQMRKVQVTINNPKEHGFDHAKIRALLSGLKSSIYYIMADEIGGKDGTYHTHIYAVFKNPVRFSTLKKRFPIAHIERAVSTHANNVAYIKKEGRWKNTEKEATSIPNTLEEWGTCPPDANGMDAVLVQLYAYIKEGLTNFEIFEKSADFIRYEDKIDRIRLTLKQEEYKNTWRDLEVIYIYGETALGKSRYVMEKYGYSNVFRVTDYLHPFDTYMGENVILFEEFSSNFRINDILNYTDGYPLKLPARYSDKTACYTKVFFTTNLPLEKQYPNVQQEAPEVWKAFLRRIKEVRHYTDSGKYTVYHSADEYFNRDTNFHTLPINEDIPFPE